MAKRWRWAGGCSNRPVAHALWLPPLAGRGFDGFLVTSHFKGTFPLPFFSFPHSRPPAKLTPVIFLLIKSYFLAYIMCSFADESVRFVGEINPSDDPSEATSRRVDSRSAGPSSSRRRSLRRMATTFRRLIDEEEEEAEGEASSPGEELRVVRALTPVPSSSVVDLGPSILQRAHIEQMREDFFLPGSLVIYVAGPQARAPFPPLNCLAFFRAQLLWVSVFLSPLSIKK
ncbi:UNVERIFIED_CONTAM: hypothetical protein Sradi_6906400 [Sesamum radiatum]|uniref:Uncharacterized protein n=1 Tax=Sesamum radiatum TaxID=300843 RepID=A0AAW2JI50_SESRA